jgi:Mrp family chromosome partitioning ATPase
VRFEDQVRAIWRQRYWLVGSALLAAILVLVLTSLRDTSYTTSAVIGVTPGPVIAGNAVAVDTVSFTASRYQRLVGSDAVLTSGASVADKGTTLQNMRERVTGSTPAGSGTVTVTVTGKTADETARVAAAVANATIAQGKADQEAQRNDSLTALRTERDALRQQLDATATDAPDRPQLESQYQSVVSDIASQQSAPFDAAQLLQTPEVPKGPTGPGPKSLALFAFLAVLILGGEAIVLWARRHQRLAQVDADTAADEPAAVPERSAASRMVPPTAERVPLPVAVTPLPAPAAVTVEEAPEPAMAAGPDVPIEAADRVAVTIMRQADSGRRLFAIAGSSDLSGTNEVTLAVAEALATGGLNTLVVEGDMTTPVLAAQLGIRAKVGLTDVLSGATSLAKALRPLSVDGLKLLTAGRQLPRPGALLAGDNMQRKLAASSAHVVLVSLPPSMPEADREEICRQLDAIVLMVRDGNLRDEQISSALLELGSLNNRLVAVGLVDQVPSVDVSYRAPRSTSPASPKTPPTAAALADDDEIGLLSDDPDAVVADGDRPDTDAAEAEAADTTMFEPDATVFAPDTTVFAPDTPTVEADTTTFAPDTTVFAPDTPTVEADTTTFEPDTTVFAPDTATFEPEGDAEVDGPVFEADTTTFEPDTTVFAPDTTTFEPDTTSFAPEGDAELDGTAFAPEPAPEAVTDAETTAESVTEGAVAYEWTPETEDSTVADEVHGDDTDVNELDDYAAFAPDPAPEVEPSANGHHDHVEDSPYEQSYDRSLHQS